MVVGGKEDNGNKVHLSCVTLSCSILNVITSTHPYLRLLLQPQSLQSIYCVVFIHLYLSSGPQWMTEVNPP